jgi:hypothetical protein
MSECVNKRFGGQIHECTRQNRLIDHFSVYSYTFLNIFYWATRSKMSTIIFKFIRTLTAWNFGEREAANHKITVSLAIPGQ